MLERRSSKNNDFLNILIVGRLTLTYVNGKHVGGNDDLQAAIKNGKFKQMLNDAGVSHSL